MSESSETNAIIPAPPTLPATIDAVPAEAAAKPATELVSADELTRARDISTKIDLNNPTGIATFGDDVQKKVGDFADRFLAEVRMRDSGRVGDELNELEALV